MGLFGGTTELGAVSKHISSRQGSAFGFMQLRGAPSISESSWAYTGTRTIVNKWHGSVLRM